LSKIYSFPSGDLIEDSGVPVDPRQSLLESIKKNPEEAANQILTLNQSRVEAIETLQKIFAFTSQYNEVWAKQITSIIQSNFSTESQEDS